MKVREEELREAEFFLRRKEIPRPLIHVTTAEHSPRIRQTSTLSPPVSATGNEKTLEYVMELIPGRQIPIVVPESERYKFKRILYPYSKPGLEIAHQLMREGKVECLSREQVVSEYGEQALHWPSPYFEPLQYVYELEVRSFEPIHLERVPIVEEESKMANDAPADVDEIISSFKKQVGPGVDIKTERLETYMKSTCGSAMLCKMPNVLLDFSDVTQVAHLIGEGLEHLQMPKDKEVQQLIDDFTKYISEILVEDCGCKSKEPFADRS